MARLEKSDRTVTRVDLAEAIYRKVGLSHRETRALVESVLDTITDEILQKNSVRLRGFGNFIVRKKRERVGRNLRTMKDVIITERYVVTFKPSQVMKSVVAGEGKQDVEIL